MTADEFMPYYEGKAQTIVATSIDGIRVQFPAMHMRKFMTMSGIRGVFCMETENNKFKSITKIQ